MKENIYNLLNDIETNIDEYEENQMTQEEKNKILNNDILKYKLFTEEKTMNTKEIKS